MSKFYEEQSVYCLFPGIIMHIINMGNQESLYYVHTDYSIFNKKIHCLNEHEIILKNKKYDEIIELKNRIENLENQIEKLRDELKRYKNKQTYDLFGFPK